MCSILVPRWCHVEYLSVDLRIKTATLPEEQSRGMLNKQVFSIVYSVVQFDLDSRYFFLALPEFKLLSHSGHRDFL